jgi:hypothetical protein
MNLLKNKYAVAFMVSLAVVLLWQGFRMHRASEAAALLGMMDYDFSTDTVDKYDAAQWDGYETGSGVPPWAN